MLRDQVIILGVLVLLLVIIAVAVVKVDRIVRAESGLTSTDTLRRMWSKPDQILFQPVGAPMLFSLIAAAGMRYTVETVIVSLLQILDIIHTQTPVSRTVIAAVSYAVSSAGGVTIYRVAGGQRIKHFVAAIVGLFVALQLLSIWAESHGPQYPHPRPTRPHPSSRNLIWTGLRIGAASCVTALCAGWASAQSPLIRSQPSSYLPPPIQEPNMGLALLLWAVTIAWVLVGRGSVLFIPVLTAPNHYLARVTARFADGMVFVCCAFVSIWCTNKKVMAGDYHWQWLSVLLPGIPAVVFGFGNLFISVSMLQDDLVPALQRAVVDVLLCSFSGLFGAAAYLGAVAMYAQQALDPGAEGQTELMSDDDDDDETREFEV